METYADGIEVDVHMNVVKRSEVNLDSKSARGGE